MTTILIALSALAVPVFTVMLVAALVKAIDAHRRRCLHSAEADMRPPKEVVGL